jgi:hypothetical protein
MATDPKQAQLSASLEDPLHEREIFASEIAGIGSVHGNIAITLATVRFDEPAAGGSVQARRVVTGRLMLTNVAAGQLLRNLQQLASQIEAATKAAASKTPS